MFPFLNSRLYLTNMKEISLKCAKIVKSEFNCCGYLEKFNVWFSGILEKCGIRIFGIWKEERKEIREKRGNKNVGQVFQTFPFSSTPASFLIASTKSSKAIASAFLKHIAIALSSSLRDTTCKSTL